MTTHESICTRLRFGVGFFIAAFMLMSAFAGVHKADARSCDPCQVFTTDYLNLRSGPGTNYRVTWVIPKGAEVTAENSTNNGYSRVIVNGRKGWAYRQYLVSADAPPAVETMVTTDYVNLRSGPGKDGEVVRVMPPLASVEVTRQVMNGYRYVYFDGIPGWAFNKYLASGTQLTTTTDLNLRAKPSTSSKVLKVMSQGAAVTLTGDESNGFVAVSYQGVKGWAFRDYLR